MGFGCPPSSDGPGRGTWPVQPMSPTNKQSGVGLPTSRRPHLQARRQGWAAPIGIALSFKHWQASFNSHFPSAYIYISLVSSCLPSRAHRVPPWNQTASPAVNGSGQRDWTCPSRRIGQQGRHHQHSATPTTLQTLPTTMRMFPMPSAMPTRNPNGQRDEPTSREPVESASRSSPRPPKSTNRSRRGSLHRRPVSNSSRKTRNSVAWSARVCARVLRSTFTRDVSGHGDRPRPCRTATFGNARHASSNTD